MALQNHRYADLPSVYGGSVARASVYWETPRRQPTPRVFSLEIGTASHTSTVWTDRTGLESLRDAINATLERADAAEAAFVPPSE